jgi:hypothetical protein
VGQPYSWGANAVGQLGLNDTDSHSTPEAIEYFDPPLATPKGELAMVIGIIVACFMVVFIIAFVITMHAYTATKKKAKSKTKNGSPAAASDTKLTL